MNYSVPSSDADGKGGTPLKGDLQGPQREGESSGSPVENGSLSGAIDRLKGKNSSSTGASPTYGNRFQQGS